MKVEFLDKELDKPFITFTLTRGEFKKFKEWLGQRSEYEGRGISGEIWGMIKDIKY